MSLQNDFNDSKECVQGTVGGIIQLSFIINKNSSNNDIYNDFEMLVESNDDDENKMEIDNNSDNNI
jgi:hypothetical protein